MDKTDKIFKILKQVVKDKPLISKLGSSSTAFEILIATMMSSRTKDELTEKRARALFEKANTPEKLLKLSKKEIEKIIYPVGFYKTKAKQIKKISSILIDNFKATVPKEKEELLKLPGIGLKTASLIRIEAFNHLDICVDTHVHRISNRLGLIKSKTTEQTYFLLKEKIDKKYWKDINKLMVPFGKTICKPIGPKCKICKLNKLCDNVKKNRDIISLLPKG